MAVFVLFCWIIPELFLLATKGSYGVRLLLSDPGAWAKFLIAPVLLTLTEKPIQRALDRCLHHLFGIPLIASQSIAAAQAAVGRARTRSSSWPAEAICLVIAASASALNLMRFLDGLAPSWAVSGSGLSVAGVWCVVVSNTLFVFLLARLIWKHLAWAGLLWEIAEGDFRLVATHPDGHGGLGFMGLYPSGHLLFNLGVSSVVAAGIARLLELESLTPALFSVICALWLVSVVAFYALPLIRLSRKLMLLKQATIRRALATATDFERAAERKALEANVFADEAEADEPGVTDSRAFYNAAVKSSALLMNKTNIMPLLVGALLPLAVVGASDFPFSQLVPVLKRLLLL